MTEHEFIRAIERRGGEVRASILSYRVATVFMISVTCGDFDEFVIATEAFGWKTIIKRWLNHTEAKRRARRKGIHHDDNRRDSCSIRATRNHEHVSDSEVESLTS